MFLDEKIIAIYKDPYKQPVDLMLAAKDAYRACMDNIKESVGDVKTVPDNVVIAAIKRVDTQWRTASKQIPEIREDGFKDLFTITNPVIAKHVF